MTLPNHVEATLHRHRMHTEPGIVAVSGGPDSVALAHLCLGLLHEGRLPRLILAHVNHLLRGDESDEDEAFVRHLAQNAGVECQTTRIDMKSLATTERSNLESIARRERYGWLTRIADSEGATWIATGHTADDQAETVLFRLLRGSGLLGLSGMAERRPLGERASLIRPLLGVRRYALLDYLRDRQIPYRVDSSNRDFRFTRNRLRLELLPALEANFNPAVIDILCRLADQAQEVAGDILELADRLRRETELPRAGDMLVFSVERLQAASPNLVREMFRLVWKREGWPMSDMDFARWQWLVEIALDQRPGCDFPGRLRVRRASDVLQISAAKST